MIKKKYRKMTRSSTRQGWDKIRVYTIPWRCPDLKKAASYIQGEFWLLLLPPEIKTRNRASGSSAATLEQKHSYPCSSQIWTPLPIYLFLGIKPGTWALPIWRPSIRLRRPFSVDAFLQVNNIFSKAVNQTIISKIGIVWVPCNWTI